MMRLSIGPSNIPAGQVSTLADMASRARHLPYFPSARLACGFWFWQGPHPSVPVFGQHRPSGSRTTAFSTGGCMAEAGRKALSTAVPPLLGLMVPFPCGAFQWGSGPGSCRAGSVYGSDDLGSAAARLTAARVQRGGEAQMWRCAETQTVSTVVESNAVRWLDLTMASHLLITIVECVTCPTKQKPGVRAVDTCHPIDWCLS